MLIVVNTSSAFLSPSLQLQTCKTRTSAYRSSDQSSFLPVKYLSPSTKLYVSVDPRDIQSSNDKSIQQTIASTLGAIAVIAFVILFHETGHYLAAKSFGVAIDEFSVGWGPKLLEFGDIFSLRALPIGGYVSMNVASLHMLPILNQMWILSAGVMFNLLLSFIIYTSQIMFGDGLQVPVFDEGVLVADLAENSPARGLLHPGDVIEGINGKHLLDDPTSSEMKVHRIISKLINEVQATDPNSGMPIIFTVLDSNSGNIRNVEVFPERKNEDSKDSKPSVGVFLLPNFVGYDTRKASNPLEATAFAANMVTNQFAETAIGLMTYARDTISPDKGSGSSDYHLSGPVGVVKRATRVVETKNTETLLKYVAGASINLGVINLIPIPPSDGFQMLYTVFHSLTK